MRKYFEHKLSRMLSAPKLILFFSQAGLHYKNWYFPPVGISTIKMRWELFSPVHTQVDQAMTLGFPRLRNLVLFPLMGKLVDPKPEGRRE